MNNYPTQSSPPEDQPVEYPLAAELIAHVNVGFLQFLLDTIKVYRKMIATSRGYRAQLVQERDILKTKVKNLEGQNARLHQEKKIISDMLTQQVERETTVREVIMTGPHVVLP